MCESFSTVVQKYSVNLLLSGYDLRYKTLPCNPNSLLSNIKAVKPSNVHNHATNSYMYCLSNSKPAHAVTNIRWRKSMILQCYIKASRRGPPASDFDPFDHAASLFSFHVWHIGIAATPAADAVFPHRVWATPKLGLFSALLFISCRYLVVWIKLYLFSRGIGRAVLYGCMSIADIAKVVNVRWREQRPSGKRVYGSVPPLQQLACLTNEGGEMYALSPSRSLHFGP